MRGSTGVLRSLDEQSAERVGAGLCWRHLTLLARSPPWTETLRSLWTARSVTCGVRSPQIAFGVIDPQALCGSIDASDGAAGPLAWARVVEEVADAPTGEATHTRGGGQEVSDNPGIVKRDLRESAGS